MAPSRRPDSFYALGVRVPLAEALAARGIVEPFPIQAASLPDSLAGRDVLGRGRTGSGKTVAFALPLLERVLTAEGRREPGRPRALVLVPTRELAVQVAETVEYLAGAVKLKTMTVFGGVRYTGQIRKLDRGVDIVVATPGRLEDLIEQGHLKLDRVEVVVLDEADMMADMGFMQPVTRILDGVPPGQRMLFSATLDNDVAQLVKKFLHEPLIHSMDSEESAPDATHYLFLVGTETKPIVLAELLSGGGRTLAFTRTKFGAERLAQQLTESGIPAVDLHGNLRQAARQRNLSKFADGTVSVLVATDIAARGIHVDDIGLVVHVDPPNDSKAFLHRSGRTARAGSEGNVVTLATRNQNKSVRALMAQAKIKPTQLMVAPGDPILTEVRAAKVAPAESGASIFEPDPEDVIEDDGRPDGDFRPRDDRPGRRDDRPGRRDDRPVRRDDRPGRRDDHGGHRAPRTNDRSDRYPSREGSGAWGRPEAAAGIEYRPRREPREHTSGARGPRPDWSDTRPRQDRGHVDRRQVSGDRAWTPRPDSGRPDSGRPDMSTERRPWQNDRGPARGGRDDRPGTRSDRDERRPAAGTGEWSADFWGPEPWEVEDRTDRRDRPESRQSGWQGDRGQARGGAGRDDRPQGQQWRPQGSQGRPAGRGGEQPAWRQDRGQGRPAQGAWGRDERRGRDDRRGAEGRPTDGRRNFDDRGGRPVREARVDEARRPEAEDRASASEPRAKNRWSAEDRAKAAQSRAHGFGFTKPGKSAKGKGPAKGKAVKGKGKDAGKPKRFSR